MATLSITPPVLRRSRFASPIEPPELNGKVYEKVVPRLVPGGWIVIDNVTSPRIQTELLKRAENDPRVDCVLLPFPKGDLICRKC
jgi:predicted O-methyltransferase YrrM